MVGQIQIYKNDIEEMVNEIAFSHCHSYAIIACQHTIHHMAIAWLYIRLHLAMLGLSQIQEVCIFPARNL